MVEMIVVSFTALLLLFGIVQFALLYNAKTVLNYAAFETARIGALNYSNPEVMRQMLAQKLSILEPVADVGGTDYEQIVAQQEAFMEDFDTRACIKRINPDESSGHWERNDLATDTDYSIPNSHLVHRDTVLKGADPLSIQDANLLKISITYCPKMIVPIVSSVVKNLMIAIRYEALPEKSFTESQIEGYEPPELVKNGFREQCYLAGRFPMVSQAIMRMQTPVGQYGFTRSDCKEVTGLAQQLGL